MSTDSASNVPIAFEPGAMSRLGGHVWEDKTGTLLAEMGDNQMSVCTQSTVYGISSYNSNSMKSDNPHSGFYEADVARTIDTSGSNPACNQGGNVVVEDSVYCIQGNAIDRSDKSGCNGKGWTEDVCYTLTATDRPAVVYSIDQGGGKSSVNIAENISPTLATTHGGSPVICYGVQENQQAEVRLSKELPPVLQCSGGKPGQGNPVVLIENSEASDKYVAAFAYQIGAKMPHLPYNEELSPTLTSHQKMAVLIENHPADSRVKISDDNVCQTLSARMGTGGGNVPLVMETAVTDTDYILTDRSHTEVTENMSPPLVARDYKSPLVLYRSGKEFADDSVVAMSTGSFQGISENVANTLCAAEYRHQQIVFKPHTIVRRLTPLECERLQGFPDNWTESESDAARYKAMGNSVALPCVDYVMSGIVDRLSEE